MPFTHQEIQSKVAAVTGMNLPFAVTVLPGDGLTVRYDPADPAKTVIEASDPIATARGFFRLTRALQENKALDIHETRHFKTVGPMLDMSRNAIMRVASVKKYIDLLAALGLNMLMLYTEDTYEVPEYPLFGALRGRYTQEELKEIDAYAREWGLELIPCVQTLAHLGTFLRWGPNGSLRDRPDILLIDSDETYALIEAMLRSLRACFSSRRIHIGMDEAMGVGLGRYLNQHGLVDRFELLSRHLKRVTDLCRKYDFHPMMWSDMFFRLGSKTNAYYDMDAHVPDSVIASLPDCDMVYWDYYHRDTDFYDAMMTEHARMGKTTAFAGGIWTWSGFVPETRKTRETMIPGLRVATKHRVETVIATEWGDDGAETSHWLATFQLPYFSETCWQGPDVSEEEMKLSGMCLTGLPGDYPEVLEAFYPIPDSPCCGKSLIWADPLLPLMPVDDISLEDFADRLSNSLTRMERFPESLEKSYLAMIFTVASEKARLLSRLRDEYEKTRKTGNRAPLRSFAEEFLPMLQGEYHDLMLIHRRLWLRDYKPQGWEMLACRYGAAMARLEDAAMTVAAYVDGDIEKIAELEEAPLPKGANYFFFSSVTSAGAAFH